METIRIPGNLYYLTGKFPPRYGTYEKLVDRLNQKGLRSLQGETFNKNIINNIVRGQSRDERVRLELIAMLAEVEGRLADVSSYLEAAEQVLNVERA
ncbi:hypothetical protein [Spirosoma areae]